MIKLRSWTGADADSLCRAASTSTDLATQMGDRDLSSVALALRYIDETLAPVNDTTHNFAISVDGQAVGNVGISNVEHTHDTAWAYYWVTAGMRGKGLATRTLATAADWAFRELQVFRLDLGHRVNNPASCSVATRSGFVAEGIERSKLKYGEQRFDVETHARLVTDASPEIPLLPLHR